MVSGTMAQEEIPDDSAHVAAGEIFDVRPMTIVKPHDKLLEL